MTLVEEAPYMRKTFAFHIEVGYKKHHYCRADNDTQLHDWIKELQKRAPPSATS